MPVPKITPILTLSYALVLGQACDSTPAKPDETPLSRVDGKAASPTPPAEPLPKASPGPRADAPDLAAALAVAVERGVVPPPAGGSTYLVDPFVLAWIVAAVEDGGDRWLTRYEVAGSGGAEVKGWQVRVQAGSPLASLGLRDGDVVEKVAHVAASDIGGVKLAVARADNELSLTVYRVDVSLTLSYRVESGLAWTRARAALGGTPWPPPQLADAGQAEDEQGHPPDTVPPPRSGSSGKALPSPSKSKPKPNPASPSKSSNKVSCSSTSVCTLDKAYFKAMLASPSKLNSQVSVVPAIANDVHSGYRLKFVKAGSPAHKMGFRRGDKITHVNGSDLTNDLEALALYAGLGSTNKFRVRYIRGGASRSKTIHVK